MDTLKLKVGLFILQEFVNGDYKSSRIRYVNRESNKYFYSDANRHCFDYDKRLYKFEKSWATKFKKTDNEQGFERSLGKRANTDGVMTYTVYEDLSKIPRLKSYQAVFGHELVRNEIFKSEYAFTDSIKNEVVKIIKDNLNMQLDLNVKDKKPDKRG